MQKVTTTCDHCGAELRNYIGSLWQASFLTVGDSMDYVHACSKEHLGFAVAKVFGVPVDATTVSLVTESNRRLEMARQATIELDQEKARAAELQRLLSAAQSAPPPITSEDEQTLWDDAHRVARRDNRPVASVLMEMVVQLRAELLAGERAQEVPTPKADAVKMAQGVKEAAKDAHARAGVDDGLVERLCVVYREAVVDAHPRRGIRAILSELASMPVEMPTADEIRDAWHYGLHGNGVCHENPPDNVSAMLRARLAPVLAAKDAEIAELENLRVDADEKRVVAQRYISELEKRLSEQSTFVDADGKTPGQVAKEARRVATLQRGVPFSAGWDTYDGKPVDINAVEEEAACAVLRAFGNGAEVLRKVRQFVDDNAGTFMLANGGHHEAIRKERMLQFVDELANQPQSFGPPIKPTKPLHELAAELVHEYARTIASEESNYRKEPWADMPDWYREKCTNEANEGLRNGLTIWRITADLLRARGLA